MTHETKFKVELRRRLIGSFGWAEVETVIEARALDAVKTGSMEEMAKPVFFMGRPYSPEVPPSVCDMSGKQVEERLKKIGIWELVEAEITKKS